MKLAIVGMIVLLMVACGPSEAEVTEQLDRHSDWVTDTVQESLIRQNDQAQKLLDNQTARMQELLDADFERDQELLDRYYESVDADLYDAGKQLGTEHVELQERIDADLAEFAKRVDENLVDSRQLYEEVLLEVKVHLVQAICEVDYWLNVQNSMLWVTLDHLEGGESTLEEAQAYFEYGIVVEEDYGTAISGICTVAEEGNWKISDGIIQKTADVRSR